MAVAETDDDGDGGAARHCVQSNHRHQSFFLLQKRPKGYCRSPLDSFRADPEDRQVVVAVVEQVVNRSQRRWRHPWSLPSSQHTTTCALRSMPCSDTACCNTLPFGIVDTLQTPGVWSPICRSLCKHIAGCPFLCRPCGRRCA